MVYKHTRCSKNIEKEHNILYEKEKEKVRQEAIEWKNSCSAKSYSWGEMLWWSQYFEQKGRRYGLLKEFRKNGIC